MFLSWFCEDCVHIKTRKMYLIFLFISLLYNFFNITFDSVINYNEKWKSELFGENGPLLVKLPAVAIPCSRMKFTA